MKSEDGQQEAAISRAFGSENRNRLINEYFSTRSGGVTPSNAWEHVYRLLLWSDPTTGLAHCYESDKCQPGKAWYARSLAFHDWLRRQLNVSPATLAHEIDWLFIRVCSDLAAAMLCRERRLGERAAEQLKPYEDQGFPAPGVDPELSAMMADGLSEFLIGEPPEEVWNLLSQKIRQYLAVQNKRKNLVGEGFEDVLAQVVRRACEASPGEVSPRRLLFEIPGFNRAKHGTKENKVDLAILRPTMRTIVTAKWSVRADREKQFLTDYEEYCNAESMNQKFQYVFVTNEFDPARLMRACEALYRNSNMFDYIVHINTAGLLAAYGPSTESDSKTARSRNAVISYIERGRLISLGQWLDLLRAH